MTTSSRRFHPLAAFAVTTAAVVAELACALWLLPRLGLPAFAACSVVVLLPVVSAGWLYCAIAMDDSTSTSAGARRILAAAVLAPCIAWNLCLLIGFTMLDWSM